MTTTVTEIGSEILVNTATVSGQDFVVPGAISAKALAAQPVTPAACRQAQYFYANGTPVGSEIRVNTATANIQNKKSSQ